MVQETQFLSECIDRLACLRPGEDSTIGRAEEDLLTVVANAIRAGGKVADDYWSTEWEVGAGPDRAEEKVEEALRAAVAKDLEGRPFGWKWISETQPLSRARQAQLREGDLLFVVDAIDGQRMFARRMPHWTIAIGVARWQQGSLWDICAAVFNPPSQELFLGLRGRGAVVLNERLHQSHELRPQSPSRAGKAVIAAHLSTRKGAALAMIKRLLATAKLADHIDRLAVMLGSGQMALVFLCRGADRRLH